MEFKLSTFSDYINDSFEINTGESTVTFELIEADLITPTPKGPGVPEVIRDDPFSLLFRGPVDQPVSQRLYSFKHEKLGEFEMFAVPVGIDEKGRYYESLFN